MMTMKNHHHHHQYSFSCNEMSYQYSDTRCPPLSHKVNTHLMT